MFTPFIGSELTALMSKRKHQPFRQLVLFQTGSKGWGQVKFILESSSDFFKFILESSSPQNQKSIQVYLLSVSKFQYLFLPLYHKDYC